MPSIPDPQNANPSSIVGHKCRFLAVPCASRPWMDGGKLNYKKYEKGLIEFANNPKWGSGRTKTEEEERQTSRESPRSTCKIIYTKEAIWRYERMRRRRKRKRRLYVVKAIDLLCRLLVTFSRYKKVGILWSLAFGQLLGYTQYERSPYISLSLATCLARNGWTSPRVVRSEEEISILRKLTYDVDSL